MARVVREVKGFRKYVEHDEWYLPEWIDDSSDPKSALAVFQEDYEAGRLAFVTVKVGVVVVTGEEGGDTGILHHFFSPGVYGVQIGVEGGRFDSVSQDMINEFASEQLDLLVSDLRAFGIDGAMIDAALSLGDTWQGDAVELFPGIEGAV